MEDSIAVVDIDSVQPLILLLRGKRVIVDADLARLYGVTTKALNQAVRRNPDRFPGDFAFQLTKVEKMEVVTICDHLRKIKYSRVLPTVFTEHGAIMAASLLNSRQAVHVSVFVVRAFVRMRDALASNFELAHRLDDLVRRVDEHDLDIGAIVDAIHRLNRPDPPPRRRIGFGTGRDDE